MLTAQAQAPSIDLAFRTWANEGLVWLPDRGMGFYPVREEDEPYKNGGAEAYWQKYVEYARAPLGEAITAARVEIVRGWTTGPVLDVGIGSGAFIEAMYAAGCTAYGHDVNPIALAWLAERGLWRDPWEPGTVVESASLWDVLEHLADPADLLARVSGFVFCSLPIVPGERTPPPWGWRHFRTDEHRWYWNERGLLEWMAHHGFECVEHDERETQLGRLDIGTFAFRRTTRARQGGALDLR